MLPNGITSAAVLAFLTRLRRTQLIGFRGGLVHVFRSQSPRIASVPVVSCKYK
jgi:hypothetical protein